MVSINPMNKGAGARVPPRPTPVRACLLCLESLYEETAKGVVALRRHTKVRSVGHHQRSSTSWAANVPKVLAHLEAGPAGRARSTWSSSSTPTTASRRPTPASPPTYVAFLTYTSGTTGPVEGRHELPPANVVVQLTGVPRLDCRSRPTTLTWPSPPLFHITGLIAGLTVSLMVADGPSCLGYRFDPAARARPDRAAPADVHPSGAITRVHRPDGTTRPARGP